MAVGSWLLSSLFCGCARTLRLLPICIQWLLVLPVKPLIRRWEETAIDFRWRYKCFEAKTRRVIATVHLSIYAENPFFQRLSFPLVATFNFHSRLSASLRAAVDEVKCSYLCMIFFWSLINFKQVENGKMEREKEREEKSTATKRT